MIRIITAPDYQSVDTTDITIFLAGSIEQGKATDWQAKVANSLCVPCTVFNPRRAAWDATLIQDIANATFNEQVTWELDHIDAAQIVFFYFQGDTLSPISLMELGIVSEQRKHRDVAIFVVCEKNFWRRGNIQVICARADIPLFDSLDVGITELKRFVKENL